MNIAILPKTPPREPLWFFKLRTGSATLYFNRTHIDLPWNEWTNVELPDDVGQARIERFGYRSIANSLCFEPRDGMRLIYRTSDFYGRARIEIVGAEADA